MFGSRQAIVNQWRRFRLTAPRAVSRLLAATLFPPRCCLCGFEGASLDLDLCEYCRGGSSLVRRRRRRSDTRCTIEPPVDEMIRRAQVPGRHRQRARAGRAAGRAACAARACRCRGCWSPCRCTRRACASAASTRPRPSRATPAACWRFPCARHAVRRVRDTPSQTALDVRQRHRNLRGAFAVPSARQLRRLLDAGHVAIVDDVMTTGSTAAGTARGVLGAAGVSQVDAWAVARAS